MNLLLDVKVHNARRDVHIVKYTDDFIVVLQYKDDVAKFWTELEKRLEMYELHLHTDKCRLIDFGKFAC